MMCGLIGVYSLVTAVLICLGYNVLYFELPLPNGSTGQLLDVMDYISNSFLDAVYFIADEHPDRLGDWPGLDRW